MNNVARTWEVSRPDEPSLGDLTSTEQEWLATATDRLRLIYSQREKGRPENCAFCIFDGGNGYVQFLAPFDAERLYCEAASAKFEPQLEALLASGGDAALRKMGFAPPDKSPNYSQRIKIDGVEDLAYAARLAFRVFKQVYHVEDINTVSFKVNIPDETTSKKKQSIGDACLQIIASTWQVDKAAVKWVDGGFDWTPGSHLVEVRAEKSPTEDRWKISITTKFLDSVPIKDRKFIEAVAAFSAVLTSTYAMQYPSAEISNHSSNGNPSKLSLVSSIYVDSGLLGWLPDFFARAALIQMTNAEIQSSELSKILGGKPDLLPGGRNDHPDEMLQVLPIYAAQGTEPSRWQGANEFVKIAEDFGDSDMCFGNGDASGLTLETPFGSQSALIRLRPDQRHPQLGNGLLVTIQFPFLAKLDDIAVWSARLNFSEANSWTDIPQLGCWVSYDFNKKVGLAHASFIPNTLHKDGLATNFAIWSISRVEWLRRKFFPELQDKTMDEILSERFKMATVR
jgi:type III secretion system-like peptide-binding chaperone